jgi:hypothetical protein
LVAVVSANTTKTRIAVPTIWSKNVVVMLTGVSGVPLPGRVEKMVCVFVRLGSTALIRSA